MVEQVPPWRQRITKRNVPGMVVWLIVVDVVLVLVDLVFVRLVLFIRVSAGSELVG